MSGVDQPAGQRHMQCHMQCMAVMMWYCHTKAWLAAWAWCTLYLGWHQCLSLGLIVCTNLSTRLLPHPASSVCLSTVQVEFDETETSKWVARDGSTMQGDFDPEEEEEMFYDPTGKRLFGSTKYPDEATTQGYTGNEGNHNIVTQIGRRVQQPQLAAVGPGLQQGQSIMSYPATAFLEHLQVLYRTLRPECVLDRKPLWHAQACTVITN